MNTQLLNVTAATVTFPKDGNGGATTEFVVNKLSTSAEVFTSTTFEGVWATANSAPNAAGGGSATSIAGDYVTTSDGCWGVVTGGITATGGTVDFWRSIGQVNRGSVPCIPLAGSRIKIYSGKCHLVGSRRPRIARILLTKSGANDTVAITNAVGVAVYTYTTATAIAAGANAQEIDFTAGGQKDGRDTEGPFGIKLSATTTAAVVEYVP